MDSIYARQGADITAADMVHIEAESKIANMFEDASILITGGTGYLGKMFLEKLLRTCPKLKMIYLLLRPKKGKDVEKRFEEIFDGPNMVPLKLANPKYIDKVSIINGDCSFPNLGMSNEDIKKIQNEVNFVIHCAATVRFDEKIKLATYINVRAVRDLITISKQMKNLKGFLHVSTAFSNCIRKDIGEEFYEPPITGDKLIELVEILSDEQLDNITPGLLGVWPNSYVFTKCVAEDIVNKEAKSLPLAVMRPSIVIASVNEPVSGWIDNLYGATGVLIGAALGVIRTLQAEKKNSAEMIPADYVINAGIAALWETTYKKSLNDNVETKKKEEESNENDEIPVYNVVSSAESPITWESYMQLAEKYGPQNPSEHQVWHYFFALRSSKIPHLLAIFFLHTIPAYLVDFICICLGKKPMMVKGYKKIHKFMDVLSYFGMNEWKFKNDNVQKLWRKLDAEDKRLFEFSMKKFDWDNYFHFYIRGARVYLLKDPLDTIPQGRVKYWKLFVAHYTLMAVLLFFFYKLLIFLWTCIF